MDVLSMLNVRFHFNGKFNNDGKTVQYCGGQEAMSYIDRDKVSLPEIIGHLRDHCNVFDGSLLHWLFPGKQLHNGLRVLVDDNACLQMSDTTVEGGVADIYVEDQHEEVADENDGAGGLDSDFEDEMDEDESSEESDDKMDDRESSEESDDKMDDRVAVITESREEMQMQVKKLQKFYSSPTKKQVGVKESKKRKSLHGEEGSSGDSDYIPGDSSASEDDEEGAEILKKFKEFKKKWKKGDCPSLDDVVLEGSTALPPGFDLPQEEGYGTPYAGSSEEEATEEELCSDGEFGRRSDGLPRFKKSRGTPSFSLGMKFRSKQQFKKAITRHGLVERKMIRFIKDDQKRVRAKCDWKHCPWVCLLSRNSRTESWQIVTFNDYHTCPPRRDNRLVTAKRIAEKYEKFIIANPTWNFASMKQTVQEDMFADVNIAKLKRAKAMVMKKIYDSTKGQYERLYDYQLELLRSNPDSTIVVVKEPNVEPPTFQRMYIGLDALKKGFLAGCRKVVGLDGCFFKGATQGELLCAIGRDANNQMYPIAWAVVEKETKDSWEWFCDLLFRDLGVGDGSDWVFISDQQKGILYAVAKWAPAAEHRNCARHIYANWKKVFNEKEWQKKFWACAKAPCVMLFNKARARLAKVTPDGAQAILNTHPQHWSRAWFRLGSNCDSVDNNLCESFNKWIIEARFFPIITMLETIRRKVMVRIHENITKSARWTTQICPNILKKLNLYINLSGACHAICNGADKFEVVHWDNRFTVDLAKKDCSCRYWQLSGLPCPHAISCIYFKTNNIEEYIANCYSVEDFRKTYAYCLNPVEGMNNWLVSDREKLKAPGYIRMPGRPKKERRRDPTEPPKGVKMSKVGGKIRCSKCKQYGHNKSSCDKRSAASSSANSVGFQSAPPNAIVMMSNTQESSTSRARGQDSTTKKMTKVTARARVTTTAGGSATINLSTNVPRPHASSSVNINISSGTASAEVSAIAPQMRKPPGSKPRPGPMLMLPPWESANL